MTDFHALEVLRVEPSGEEAVLISLAVAQPLRAQFTGRSGQHVVVRVTEHGEELRRTYSLVSPAGCFPLQIAVRQHARGRMSQHLCTALEPGAFIDVMPPRGSFHSATEGGSATAGGGEYLAIAAGCGITPVLAVIADKLEKQADARFALLYGNRHDGRIMCLEEVMRLKDRFLDRLAVQFFLSDEANEPVGPSGRIDGKQVNDLAGVLFEPERVTEAFVCGPGEMIETISATLVDLGIAPGSIHAEHFTIDTVTHRLSAPVGQASVQGAEVTVVMDGRRRSFMMASDADSILDAALAQGVNLPYSCCAGVCSTCRARVVDGAVDMAENYALEEWELEEGYVLACQSRPTTPEVTLDYDEI